MALLGYRLSLGETCCQAVVVIHTVLLNHTRWTCRGHITSQKQTSAEKWLWMAFSFCLLWGRLWGIDRVQYIAHLYPPLALHDCCERTSCLPWGYSSQLALDVIQCTDLYIGETHHAWFLWLLMILIYFSFVEMCSWYFWSCLVKPSQVVSWVAFATC